MKSLSNKTSKPIDYVGRLRATLSDRQLGFVDSPSRWKVLVAGRRGGKSFVDAAYMIIKCLTVAQASCLYLGLTRQSAKDAVWPILLMFLESAKIPHTVGMSDLSISFPNGSRIRITGADMSNAQARLRGQKFHLIIIDECGFYATVDDLVISLLPSLADYQGTMALTSSPGMLMSGLFYDAYLGDKKDDWEQFHWTLLDNPHFQKPSSDPHRWQTMGHEELETICRIQFNGDRSAPGFVREYLGQYDGSDKSIIYPFDSSRVATSYLARKPQTAIGVVFGLGLTVGVVRMRYSPYSRQVFIDSSHYGVMSPDEAGAYLKTLDPDPTMILMDVGPYADDVGPEFQKRHDVAVKIVDNDDKTMFQSIFVADLLQNHILLKGGLPLIDEWRRLMKDEDGLEIEGQKHLQATAALMVYRHIYQTHLATYTPPPTDEEIMINQLELLVKAEKEEDDEQQRDGDYLGWK